jgi:hypothetical protein
MWAKCPLIQLGAENNIEKSRCLAQLRKKILRAREIDAGFSGFASTSRDARTLPAGWFTAISGM